MAEQHLHAAYRTIGQRSALIIGIALCIVGGRAADRSVVHAQDVPSSSGYQYNSPHWNFIRVADMGRPVKWMSDPNQRAAAYEWYARHVDLAEVGLDTFTYTFQNSEKSLPLKQRNPTITTTGYDIFLAICQHAGCYDNPSANTNENALPEDYYLHFATTTRLAFSALDGTPITTITVPGCPVGTPITADCRVQTYIWTDARWLTNVRNQDWQHWYADHLVDELSDDPLLPGNVTDGLYLDESGPGFAVTVGIGSQTTILSGGAIREYDNRIPRDPSTEPNADALDAEYSTDVTSWLTYLQERLAAAGKFAHVNTAEWFMDPSTFQEGLAMKGVFTEHLHTADDWRVGTNQYEQFISQVQQLEAVGGSIDLAGTLCYDGPATYTAGNYPTAADRFKMWNLASYYLVKEPVGSSGKAWFDPNLCIHADSATPLDFEQQWLLAYEKDVGQPVDLPSTAVAGSTSCNSMYGFKVFERHYTNMTVLVRPRDGWTCTDYGDDTAATVSLDRPMVMLEPDGTYSAPMTSVLVRNAEAVILFDAPDTTAPSPINNLTAN